MYRYTVIAVGKMKNRSLAALCDEFEKRLKRQGAFELIELKDSEVESEGQRILEALDKRKEARIYAMAEEGGTCRSKQLAAQLGALQGQPAVFVVGGAYGLSDVVKQRADVLLSLSPMTFTHEIARMLLFEQLYRAVSIQTGSKYHHGE
jgi:23S rRNA (pseudouridine1915-N3)-methyltransferase